jgi:anthranilate phosphoribosyltransferase
MTPLLGRWLADLGYLVLIHGTHEDPLRTSSEQVFNTLGWTVATAQDNLQTLLQQQQLVYCPLEVICPPLNQLLAVRQIIGVRNSGHILAKLINPVQSQSFQICNYTHPAYPLLLEDFFKLHPANVVSMRGHEGEPVASPRRLPELNIRLPQAARAWITEAEFDETPAEYARGIDAHATATLYKEILSGASPAPQTLRRQVHALHEAFSTARQTPVDAAAVKIVL